MCLTAPQFVAVNGRLFMRLRFRRQNTIVHYSGFGSIDEVVVDGA